MIRTLATHVLAAPPTIGLLRRRALADDPVSILCYHTLGPDQGGIDGWTVVRASDFRTVLSDLATTYEIVSLDAALTGARTGTRPRVVLTFDDGDRGLYHHFLPILQETGHPATVYVATAQIETGQPFWFDRVVNALQTGGPVAVEGLGTWQVPETGGKARWEVLRDILARLKATPPETREALTNQVVAAGRSPAGPALGPMTRDELTALAAMPGLTVGAHSHGHELLDQIPLAAARASVARSRDLLRKWTGQEVAHFAFPNGNHTPALRDMVRDLGFTSATILEDQLAPSGADRFALPRLSVGRYDTPARVRLRLVGL